MKASVTPSMTDLPAAPRAGADLRAARERLGLSLDDVAATLRIRPSHLAALEDGRIARLPGNAYALAFVRTYAGTLGLEAEEMVRRFKAEAAAFSRRPELVFPVPMPERGLPAGALALLGLMMAVGAYAGWYHLSGEGRLPAEVVASVPERLASLADQALPQPIPVPVDTMPVAKIDEPPPVVLVPGIFSPSSAAAAQLPPRPADDSPKAGLLPEPINTPRILLRATADAWLQVKDRGGAVLLNRVLKAGETWPVPPRPDLLLTTGNAGGTDIMVDGVATAGLGGNGVVRRDLLLDPEQIKDGKLATAPAPSVASVRPRQ